MTTWSVFKGVGGRTEQHAAWGCESLRTALLKIKHVAVNDGAMEVGTQGLIGKKI